MIYCDVCASMVVAINLQPGLVKAQLDWQRENEERVKEKERLLGGEA